MQISETLTGFHASATSGGTPVTTSAGDDFAAALAGSTAASDQAANSQTATTAKKTSAPDPVAAFLAYMKETPAERLEDAWLASHHLTRKDLEAMPPDKRRAIEQQMEAEIKQQLEQETAKKSSGRTSVLA